MTPKKIGLAAGGAFLAAAVVYGAWIEPRMVSVSRVAIKSGQPARQPVTIALLSDLHLDSGSAPLEEKVLRRLEAIRPDLIVLAGDYVAWGGRGPAYERALNFLARLEAPLGVYAVLGDADTTFSRKSCEFCHAPGSGAPTSRHEVVFLKNDSRVVDTPNGRLRIVGIDMHFPRPGGQRLQELLAGETPTILVSHSPGIYEGIDPSMEVLTVSGDTHGGQVWLPRWFWRLMRLTSDPDHIHGLFHDGRKSLVVTRGLGTSRFRFRLGAPPEIVVLEFPAVGR